jgi:hypothetical protein
MKLGTKGARKRRSRMKLTAGMAALGAATILVAPAAAKAPPLYKNCTHLNARYHHGVGKATAHDKTSGRPVTTFKRSNKLYATAIKWNRSLDRDKDGIACEKA